jgi:hypothetical protein
MHFDDLVRELAPAPNRVGRCAGDLVSRRRALATLVRS